MKNASFARRRRAHLAAAFVVPSVRTLRSTACATFASLAFASSAYAADADVKALTDRQVPQLVAMYRELHAAPELSRFEAKTSARLAQELRAAGYDVTERVGKYFQKQWQGYGVVAVMKNGAGPTVLIRGDMDALPVEEKTGLPYASTVRFRTDTGAEIPVMHACGHDLHVTSLVGVARVMAALKKDWRGTLVLVGQPAEETMDGAVAMLNDGLYHRFPKPDVALALHNSNTIPAGTVGVTPGYALATSTQMDVVVRGLGGHGSRPEEAKDPVVLAAAIVLQLQTIVSREISPFDQAVLTVGTIHGGLRRNIIPDEVKLELNLRSYKDDVRQHMIDSVRRIARGAAIAAGMPEDRMPVVTVLENEVAPALYNDPAIAERLIGTFTRVLGPEGVIREQPLMGSEDFGNFGLKREIPTVLFGVGTVPPEKYAAAKAAGTATPSPHSPLYAPDAEPALRTGIVAMSSAALELLKPRR